MFKTLRRAAPAMALLAAGALWMTARPAGQATGVPSTKNGDWTHYTADVRGTRYVPLDQINTTNFNKLEVAWRFKTDNLGTRPEYKLEGTPLAIKGVLVGRDFPPLEKQWARISLGTMEEMQKATEVFRSVLKSSTTTSSGKGQ